jgi:hypothetical protein
MIITECKKASCSSTREERDHGRHGRLSGKGLKAHRAMIIFALADAGHLTDHSACYELCYSVTLSISCCSNSSY